MRFATAGTRSGISIRALGSTGTPTTTGSGSDTIVFFGTFGPADTNTITNFATGVDLVEFGVSECSILPSGAPASSVFVANTSGLAQDASDRIVFQSNTGKLFVDQYGLTGATAVLFAQLLPNASISQLDFNIFLTA